MSFTAFLTGFIGGFLFSMCLIILFESVMTHWVDYDKITNAQINLLACTSSCLKGLFLLLLSIYMFVLCDIINLSTKKGVSYMKLTNNLAIDTQLEIYRQNGFSYAQTKKIKRGLTLGFDPSLYTNVDFTPHQIEIIITCLTKRLDVTHLVKERYDWTQVDEIYAGLICGIDVSSFANNTIPWLKMRELRKQVERETYDLWN